MIVGGVAETPVLWFDARMSTTAIEQELNELKKRVEALEKAAINPKHAWREIVGTLPGDELDREAARLGAEWRAKENARR